jgi:hypothetical protein
MGVRKEEGPVEGAALKSTELTNPLCNVVTMQLLPPVSSVPLHVEHRSGSVLYVQCM